MSKRSSLLRKIFLPNSLLLRTAYTCFAIGVVSIGITLQKIPRLPLDGAKLEFDQDKAHSLLWELAKNYPYRLPWHENRLKAAAWIKKTLRSYDLTPQDMVFSENIAGKTYNNLNNIYVEIKGKTSPDQIIAVVAHYDTTDTTIEGAMDDAGGTAIVMELARVFSKFQPDRTFLFLLTDSEEFGALWGAKTFAESYGRAHQIVAAINLDFPSPEKQVAILQLGDGLKTGFTPLWLRELALDSLRSIGGFEARDLIHFAEFASRAIGIPASDHGAFLAAGIPSFNWVGQTDNFAYVMAHYHHTVNDVAENIRPESLGQMGMAAERLMRSINSLARIPVDFRNSAYIKVTNDLYLGGFAILFLQILMFVPFLVYTASKFGKAFRSHPKSHVKRVVLNELKNIGILCGSLLMGYALLRLMPALKIITQYELFPATQKSKLLYTPNFLAIGLVLGSIGLAYWVFRRFFSAKSDSEESAEIRHACHAIGITLIIIVSFIANAYLATLLLLPVAYCWTAVRSKNPTRQDRFLNALLLLGGSITMVIMGVILTNVFHVGVLYWYIFLAISYGLFSVQTVVTALIVIAVLLRLIKANVLKSR